MLFLPARLPKNFAADERNIMQEYSECLEVTHSHPNFTIGNQFKGIMKKNADAGNIDNRRNPHRRGSSSKNAEIETYLSTHYEFRYNTVLGRTEYRSKGNSRFVKVGRYEINTLRRELDSDGDIATSSENLYSIIESSFSPRINPVQEYFKELPLIDIGDGSSNGGSYSGSSVPFSLSLKAISDLASCVVVRNNEKWLPYLTKWLVAVVANAMNNRECRNHTCLVLTGEQGKFKTSFLDLLCPPALHGYSYTGKIYPQEKDTLTYIGQNLIVNIDDQLKALNKRDENELKNLITCPMVKYRMPYDKYVEEHPHLASFVASVNGNDFLTDPTGSRRFLPFEVLSIDIEKAKRISMDNVYAEAKALLKLGFRYWFDDDEIAELYRESEDFQVQTAEMELLLRCFEKPTEDENYSLMTTTEILTYLGIYTHQPLVAKRMGEALKKAGYIKVSKRRNGGSPIYVYKIRKILPCPLLQTCSSQM
ncbi:VapE domain-containing protein [Prevotella denticola]|uniref:VapE domain-containing protein n=1 Tax=Prevotella denticola TaxID=28129 RepID=UPI000201267B|nr:VapE domain-containing protein [Prevotella denticola]AEA21142.1 Virulence-associated protein E [Prevotella denticola F0289]QUB89186.1 virulence protein [Prevotella denticola]